MNNKKVVLISGASRGIGRASAIKFAKEGYNLSLCAVNRMDLLKELKSELEKFGSDIYIQKCDVSNSTEVKSWVKNSYEHFSRIDVLVSNAGIASYSLLVDTEEEEFDRIINVNLKGAFLLSKEVYDIMVSQKSGSIVFVSSIWGIEGASFESVYSASKAGLIGLANSLKKELEPSNINVNVVNPPAVMTDMMSGFSDEELIEISKNMPDKRILEPSEIADEIYALSYCDNLSNNV